MDFKLSEGMRNSDDQIFYKFIPPAATSSTFGGIKAKAKITEENEIVIDNDTGKLYVGSSKEVINARTVKYSTVNSTVPYSTLSDRLNATDDNLYKTLQEVTRARSNAQSQVQGSLKERIDSDINGVKVSNVTSYVTRNSVLSKSDSDHTLSLFTVVAQAQTDVEISCNYILDVTSKVTTDMFSISNAISYSIGTNVMCSVLVDELEVAIVPITVRYGSNVFNFSVPYQLTKGSHKIQVKMCNPIESGMEDVDKLTVTILKDISTCYVRGQYLT